MESRIPLLKTEDKLVCVFLAIFPAGQDYDTASGTFTFSPTATLLCVNVAIRDDAIAETQECFNFNLNTPAGVSNPQPNTPVCIVDDDSTQQC